MAQKKVVIIEDNAMNLELVSDLLELNGFKVSSASTAEDGIDLIKQEKPDLILMDISLPSMSGFEAIKILKEDSITSKIPVVALTARAIREEVEKILSSGFNGYISKPIDTREFPKAIENFISEVE